MNQECQTVYHISDRSDIKIFEPRPSRLSDEALVWAIDCEHLPNYILPRDCPRVTFFAREESDPEDIERIMCGTSAGRIIVVENTWYPRIRTEKLYRYEFDTRSFKLTDDIAGYYVSREPATPLSVYEIDDIITELLSYNMELRFTPSLWKLREAVIHSTLGFSLIRMRNATPPEEGYEAYHPLA